MLDGYRGTPAGDRTAMNALMTRLSALVEVVPELVELELNPVKLLAPGKGAIVVDGRMLLRRRKLCLLAEELSVRTHRLQPVYKRMQQVGERMTELERDMTRLREF